MPLVKGKQAASKAGFKRNIEAEMRANKSQPQAVAIAFRLAGEPDKPKSPARRNSKPVSAPPSKPVSKASMPGSMPGKPSAASTPSSPNNPLADILRAGRSKRGR